MPGFEHTTCSKCGQTALAFICAEPGCPVNGGAAYPWSPPVRTPTPPADQAQADAREFTLNLLRKHEWSGKSDMGPFCPACGGREAYGVHTSDCRLAAALRDPAPDGDARIRELEAEVERLNETWNDGETVWSRPTAWAYAQACKVINGRQLAAEARATAAEAALAVVQEALEALRSLSEKASPGEWRACPYMTDKGHVLESYDSWWLQAGHGNAGTDFDKDDATFVAAAVNIGRDLLARTAPDGDGEGRRGR